MTDGPELFSVVIPVKNAVGTLGRTLEALRAQTYGSVEIIVVDGGSTDGTLELIGSAGLPGLRVLSDPTGGITSAVNKGIRDARGAWVLPWMCADDYVDPDFLSCLAGNLVDPTVDFAYGNWHVVDRGVVIKDGRPADSWREDIRFAMPMICPNTFAFRKSVYDRVGHLDESLRFANDYDFLRRLVKSGANGAYAEGAWYYYQLGGLSERRLLETQLEVVRAAIAHGSPRSAVYAVFVRMFVMIKISFWLNRIRRLLRNRRAG
jgi:glycosyltransferase involved in cell wall biosynthesis